MQGLWRLVLKWIALGAITGTCLGLVLSSFTPSDYSTWLRRLAIGTFTGSVLGATLAYLQFRTAAVRSMILGVARSAFCSSVVGILAWNLSWIIAVESGLDNRRAERVVIWSSIAGIALGATLGAISVRYRRRR
jgi:hypothetical protein